MNMCSQEEFCSADLSGEKTKLLLTFSCLQNPSSVPITKYLAGKITAKHRKWPHVIEDNACPMKEAKVNFPTALLWAFSGSPFEQK